MNNCKLTVITPTTGKESLNFLMKSILTQKDSHEIYHIILWDDYRNGVYDIGEEKTLLNKNKNMLSLYIPGTLGKIWGSHLRAVGLNIATTPYVTFADDDVWWEPDYYAAIKENIIEKDLDWGGVRRKVWNPTTEKLIGYDNFESIGNSKIDVNKRVPYEMLDGNCMIFRREYGVYASPLYREIQTYGDDRLLYDYLKENSYNYNLLSDYLINQSCPIKLIEMFEKNCKK